MSVEPREKKETSFYTGVLLTSFGSMSNIVVLFAETVVAVRILSPEIYGVYVLLVAVANFLVMGIDFGCKIAVTQQIASAESNEQSTIVNSVILFRLVCCAMMALIIWAAQDILLWLEPAGNLLLYASWIPAMFIVTSLDQLVEAMLKGFKQYKHVAIAQTLRSILRFVLTVLFLSVFGMGILGVVASWITSFALSFAFQYYVLPIRKRLTVSLPVLRRVLKFGAPIQATYFLWHVSGQVQVVILSSFAGTASVALFDVAAKIPTALQRFSESFISVYFPTMSSLLSSKQNEKAAWMLDQSLKLSSFLSGIGVLFAVLFSRDIMTQLFSSEYSGAALAFSIMMVAFHMMFLVNLLGYTLTSAGYPQLSLVENSVRATVSLVASIILIPWLNVNGAAASRLLSNYASNPVAIWMLRKKDIPVTMSSFGIQTAILWAGCILGWFVPVLGQTLLVSVAIRVGIIASFIGLNILLGTVTVQEVHSLVPQSLLKRIGLVKPKLAGSV